MKKQHLSTDTKAQNKEEKVDKHLQDSFPTSDPPSHSPGTIGAPNAHSQAQNKNNGKDRKGGR